MRLAPTGIVCVSTLLLAAAASPARAQSSPCAAYAGKQYVVLLQGEERAASGVADAAVTWLGRLSLDASGTGGTFSLVRNLGETAAIETQTGTMSCGASRGLGSGVQELRLSNGLNLVVLRDRANLQLSSHSAQMAVAGEARPAASVDGLAGGACTAFAGRSYVGHYGRQADAYGHAGVASWTVTTWPRRLRSWWTSTVSAGATPVDSELSSCVAGTDGGAFVAVDQGSLGQQIVYPAADGSAAWMHGIGGRGVGGWLRSR